MRSIHDARKTDIGLDLKEFRSFAKGETGSR